MSKRTKTAVVPTTDDYLALKNQVIRASYQLPMPAKRLLALALAAVRAGDDHVPWVVMDIGDIVRALEIADAGTNYELIRAAARELQRSIVSINTDDTWTDFNWCTGSRGKKSDRTKISIKLNDELAPFILDFQAKFTTLMVADYNKLQGFYSTRVYELVMERSFMAGKGGNKPGHWYVDLMFAELRRMFQIADATYAKTAMLRINVIERPVREINAARIGIYIECDTAPHRYGKRVLGVRLYCKQTTRGPRVVNPKPATSIDAHVERMTAEHNEEYWKLVDHYMSQGNLFKPDEKPFQRKLLAQEEALKEMRRRYPKEFAEKPS